MPLSAGSPIEVDFAPVTQNPAAVSVTVPASAVSAVVMISYYNTGSMTLSDLTLGGNQPNNEEILSSPDAANTGITVAEWTANLPASGSQDLAVSFSAAPVDGPACVIFFLDDVGAFIGLDTAQGGAAGSAAATVAGTGTGDEVYGLESDYNTSLTPPGTPTGWTSLGTGGNDNLTYRLCDEDSPSSGSTYTSVDNYYSAVAIIAFEAGGGGGAYSPGHPLSSVVNRVILAR